MKVIKMFGNTTGLVLLMAIVLICISGPATPFSSLDALLFDAGARLTSKSDIPESAALITLPVTRADELTGDPSLSAQLIQFLDELNDIGPAAAVFMLDGYPHTVVNGGMIEVEKKLEQVLAQADTKAPAEISDILAYVKDASGPGSRLTRALRENGVLVAMKTSAPASAWQTPDMDIAPYQTMAAEDPGKGSLFDRLPSAAGFHDMPAAGAPQGEEGETGGAIKVIPLFSDNPTTRGWPLVWKYGDGFLADLVTLLFQKDTQSADPVWVERKGVRFDYYLMPTDFSGRLRPMLLTSGRRELEIDTFPIAGMAFQKNLASLKNRVVLIGAAEDPALRSTALSLLSMRGAATAYTPVWGMWLEKGLLLLFAGYLVFLLQRLHGGLGVVASALLMALCLALQMGMLVTKGLWLPAGTAMVYLIAGHLLMQFKFHTKRHLLRLEMKKHDAFLELGTNYAENRRFDKAFDAFKECLPNREALDSLYDLALAYERRQKLKKACTVFEYIDSRQENFRGAGKRAGQLKDFLEGRPGSGGADGTETIGMPTFELQRTVLGRYEIERELGRGAMGIVYLGRDPKIGRRVAIKTLDLADTESREADHDATKSRFFREAEAIGRLNHPNIVTVYDVGEEDDLAFIAMDFLTGQPLVAYTDKSSLLPVPKVYNITVQVAEALAYAHSQNVIHRDIKPGNIIYDEKEGLIKVTDFGIARLVDATLTSTHTILGSPSFMAPEQLRGSHVDGRADIFSLGVTFFQLLTGQFPFGGSDLATITYQITNAETPDVGQFRSGLPKSATQIVYRALAKEPDQRYQTAAEMATALRRGAPRFSGVRKKK